MHHVKPMVEEPGVEVRRLAGPDLVVEPGREEPLPEHEPGVGREHQVRQPRLRPHLLDGGPEPAERFAEGPPLVPGDVADGGEGALHPRVDFVLDPVVVGRAHQDAGGRSHRETRGGGRRRSGWMGWNFSPPTAAGGWTPKTWTLAA